MGLPPRSRSQSHSALSLCSSSLIRTPQNKVFRYSLALTQSARPESAQELQPDVLEAGSSEQQQQTLDAFVAEQTTDGSNTLSDMSVEDPPTFEELGIDKLLVVSM
jgi:hypothetical protein